MRPSGIATSSIIVLSHFRCGTLLKSGGLINRHTTCSVLVLDSTRLRIVDEDEFRGHCVSPSCWTRGRRCRGRRQFGSHFFRFKFDVSFLEFFHRVQGRVRKRKGKSEKFLLKKRSRLRVLGVKFLLYSDSPFICGEEKSGGFDRFDSIACSKSKGIVI